MSLCAWSAVRGYACTGWAGQDFVQQQLGDLQIGRACNKLSQPEWVGRCEWNGLTPNKR